MILAPEGMLDVSVIETDKGFNLLRTKDLIDRLIVPNFDDTKPRREQVVAYLAGLPEERTKVIFSKIKVDGDYMKFIFDVNMARAELKKAAQPVPTTHGSEIMAGLGIGAGVATAEATRRAELLVKGATQEYFGAMDLKDVVHAVRLSLDQELSAGDLVLNAHREGNGIEFELLNDTGDHLLTVVLGHSQRTSQLSPDLPLDVTTVTVGASNTEFLTQFALAHASRFAAEAEDVMSDGQVSAGDILKLALKGLESVSQVGKKTGLSNTIFDALNKVLVEAERVYQEERHAKLDQAYIKAKAEKDARICASCGSERVDGRSDCAKCGAPYPARV